MATETKTVKQIGKPTPEPWEVISNSDRGQLGCRVLGPVQESATQTVLTPWASEANARLIAAAPDLLQVVQHFIQLFSREPQSGLWESLYRAADNAAAKAEGR